jgi:hypothetical protein
VVQAGDTLKSIAQAVYGNASLWYVIAQANAIEGDSQLAVGQDLTIPEVKTNQNDSTTYKPYNSSEIAGSTTPGLPTIAPPPPPPSGGHCSTLATIIIIAVIVVVTIYTAGAAASAFGSAAATGGSTFASGVGALTGAGGLSAATVGAAAVGGFVGNAAGQLTGDGLGVSHGFSFGEAATAGLTAGITAGVGGVIQTSGSSILLNGPNDLSAGGQAVLSATSYAAQSGAAKLAGQPSQFSWAGLVASAAASGITASTGLNGTNAQGLGLSAGDVGRDVAGSLLSGTIQRETSLALGDDRVGGWGDVTTTAVGTAIGSAAVQALREREQIPVQAKTASSPLDEWRQSIGTVDVYGSLGAASGEFASAGNALTQPSIGLGAGVTNDARMAQAAYGSRADWIASVDTSAYNNDGLDLAAAEDVPGVKDPSLPQISSPASSGQEGHITWQASSDQQGNISWHARSDSDPSGPHLVLRDANDLEKHYIPTSSDLPPITPTAAPASGTLNWVPATTLDTIPVYATVPRDGNSVGDIARRVAEGYRSGRQDLDDGVAWVDSQIPVVESSIDTFRSDLRDWSGQHGGFIGSSIGRSLADHIGVAEGFASGAAHMATGTTSLALAATDLVNPVAWALDGQRNVDHLVNAYQTADAIHSVVDPASWITDPQKSLATTKALWNGVTKEYRKDFANGDVPKLLGRGVAEFGSAIGPLLLGKIGRLETAAKAVGETSAARQVAQDAAVAGSRLDQGVVRGVNRASVPNTTALGDSAAVEQGANVRAYPDGSLRTPDGKFASVSGMPAPGTANAAAYADFLKSNGVDVVGTEMEVNGPLGVRKYDIVTRNGDGTLFGIEVKSGGATPTPYQRFSDMYVNQFGAAGRGRISGQTVTGSYTVYLPPGG